MSSDDGIVYIPKYIMTIETFVRGLGLELEYNNIYRCVYIIHHNNLLFCQEVLVVEEEDDCVVINDDEEEEGTTPEVCNKWIIGQKEGMRIRYLFQRIRILPVTMDLLNYFHLEQNINQNQQIQA